MNVCSIEWVAGLLLVSAFFFCLPGIRLRQGLLAACNAGFVATLVPNPAAWVALILFLALGFGVARLLLVYRKKAVLVVYLAALLVSFVVLKQYAFAKILLPDAWFTHGIAVVGLSYMLFRQIHVVVDAYQEQLGELTLWDYLAYQLNLFGFLAGPIQRFPQFREDWSRLEPVLQGPEQVLRAYLRVFVGVLKITLVAATCLEFYERFATVLEGDAPQSRLQIVVKFLAVFYLYPVYVYFNFSGYCDIVIGGASLVGIRMPENFDRPYVSRNMIEYWTRWHRTLGFWIRDYVFTPMYTAIASRWPQRASSLAFLCYFVALFLTGIWHGSTWNFVIFGLLNGLGVAAAKLWENHLVTRRGRPGLKQYLARPGIRRLAIFGTLNFVCLTIYFFPADLERSLRMAGRFFSALA